MGDQLLPCPFCGEKAIRCENFTGLAMFWTQCGSCHACPGGDHATREKADAAWNTRAQGSGEAVASSDVLESVARLLCRQHYGDRGLAVPGINNVVESDWPAWSHKAEEVLNLIAATPTREGAHPQKGNYIFDSPRYPG